MKHIDENNIVEVATTSENPNFPVVMVLDEHPKRPYKAEDSQHNVVVTAGVVGGCDSLMIAGTNADVVTVNASYPTLAEWGGDDRWGVSTPIAVAPTELMDNGDFDDTVGWTIEGGWIIGGGIASFSSSVAGDLLNDFQLVQGQQYRLSFDLPTLSGTSLIHAKTGASTYDQLTSASAGERQVIDITATSAASAGVRCGNGTSATVDNVSLQEINEHVVNGGFAVNVDSWVAQNLGVFVWDSGRIKVTRSLTEFDGAAQTNIPTVNDQVYSITFTGEAGTRDARLRVMDWENSTGPLLEHTESGTFTRTLTFKATSSSISVELLVYLGNGYAFFDDISIVEAHNLVVDGNFTRGGVWTIGDGWSEGSGVASCDGSQASASSISQTIPSAVNDNFVVQYTVSGRTQGSVRSALNIGNLSELRNADGTYTDIITSSSTPGSVFIVADVDFIGSISNVSVQAVTIVNGQWVTDTELLTNGRFEGLTTDWIPMATGGGSTDLTAIGGSLRVTATDASLFNIATQGVPTVDGDMYNLVYTATTGTAAWSDVVLGSTIGGSDIANSDNITTGTVTEIITFKAQSVETFVSLRVSDDLNDGVYADFDGISVKRSNDKVENGEFSTNRVWNSFNSASLSFSGRVLTVTNGSSIPSSAYQVIDTIVGAMHRITITVGVGLYGAKIFVGSSIGVSDLGTITVDSSDRVILEFTATSATSVVHLGNDTATLSASVDFSNLQVYELSSDDRDEWGSKDIPGFLATATQSSGSNAFWLDFETIIMPVDLEVNLYTSLGSTIYAGIMRSAIAETYIDQDLSISANPRYGLAESREDLSISIENSNGSQYYNQRDILRNFSFNMKMSHSKFYDLMSSYDTNGKRPTAWKLTNKDGNNWVVFARFYNEPVGNFNNYQIVTASINLTEVL